MRKKLLVLLAGFSMSACGAITPEQSEPEDDMQRPPGGPGIASAQELRIYVEQMQPEAVRAIRFEEPLRWRGLNPFYAITEARNGPHLIEMSWECKELVSRDLFIDMADVRTHRGVLRAGVDTLRGCKIDNFYKLPKPEPSVPETETETEAETE